MACQLDRGANTRVEVGVGMRHVAAMELTEQRCNPIPATHRTHRRGESGCGEAVDEEPEDPCRRQRQVQVGGGETRARSVLSAGRGDIT